MTLRLFSRLCGLVAVVAALLVLAGWAWDVPALEALFPGFPATQPTTALVIGLLGGGLLSAASDRPPARGLARALSVLVALICVATILAYAGFDIGVDRWLFPDRVAEQRFIPHPGRMGQMTITCALLLAFAIAAKARRRWPRTAVGAATVALLLAAAASLAFVFNAGTAGFASVSIPTAAVLAVLGAGVLAAPPLTGWPRRLTLDTPGGAVSRLLLPLAVLTPAGIGAIALIATREGYFSPDFRLAVVCAVTATAFGAMVIWAADRIDALEAARQQLRHRAAEAQAGETRLRAVADAVPGLLFEGDAEGRNTYVNARYLAYTGLPFDELLGEGWRQVVHPDDLGPLYAVWIDAVREVHPVQQEVRIRRADGAWRWFMLRAAPARDAEGQVEKWIGVATDITDQREAMELQRTLLQEVSHRVKNSLALVSSLLGLQARTLQDAPRRALEDAAARVHAVARVHDQLWRGAGMREIDLSAFLTDLCAAVAGTAPQHATRVDAEPAVVSADLAVPLGLLVNELLTNAYKYAYPEGEGGEVQVRGASAPGGRYRLEVTDRGRGLPADFNLAGSRESLGMRVVTSLAAQLGGELTAGSAEPGARFTLEFPLGAAAPSSPE
ncbi:sensor histidine kinase [Caulobacter sp. 17J80-11]|uniref:sensor histidine kinase n=1 Tax=Caulobacter sp. 17J80-11 TaxID=2763502 RepID=UPI001653497D|nr:histidine kinase dimerization/phosphoacceptor domain -containing protein [Caulobacter sp. 17J80-11]MBC6980736.1 PAS domain-containing protein [Caulobacter sp. 17J80-11]